MSTEKPDGTAIVLGGGGVLGAVQVGMLRALIEAGVRPSLVVGTSVGALNGAVLAALPLAEVADRLDAPWGSPDTRGLFAAGTVQRLRELARSGVAVHRSDPLRRALTAVLGKQRIEDLPVTFTCCAANVEDAAEYWFDHGLVVDAVLASAAVPGLLPPVVVQGRHYLDGGLVNSIPLGHAIELGARRVFVLHVGRIDQPLRPPQRPWPNRFIPGGGGAQLERRISELATALDHNDAFVIFPEGGNFTERRRLAAIARLRGRGLHDMARRSETMRHVLAPHPGGVTAALTAAPDADVVWVTHSGLDHLYTAIDIWRELPLRQTVQMRWWRVPAADVPRDESTQIEWLYQWWQRIDDWIDTTRRP